jgi:hypothetical protein
MAGVGARRAPEARQSTSSWRGCVPYTSRPAKRMGRRRRPSVEKSTGMVGPLGIGLLRLIRRRGIAPDAPSAVGLRHSRRSSDSSRANCSWIGRQNKSRAGSSGNFQRKAPCGFPTKPSTEFVHSSPRGAQERTDGSSPITAHDAARTIRKYSGPAARVNRGRDVHPRPAR